MGQNTRGVGRVPCPSLREASSSARHDRFPWKPLGQLGRLSAAAMEACCPLGDGPHYEWGRPWASSSRPLPRPTPSWRLSLSYLPLHPSPAAACPRRAGRGSPLPLLTPAARSGSYTNRCIPGTTPHHHPTPRSLQSRPLPSGDISQSKGPGPARNCDTEPQPAFPVFLRLPCLGKGLSSSPHHLQAGAKLRELQGWRRAGCWAFREFLTVGALRGVWGPSARGRGWRGGWGGKKSLQHWMVWDGRL